jgi:enhancing lycopene biosynthesis protein 2
MTEGTFMVKLSEITESVSCLIAMSKHNIRYQCYSLDKDQYEVVNHLNGEKQSEKRNVLQESARIARGDIKNLQDLQSEKYDVMI